MRKAFTLVEIMIVVAIVALLSAIAIPNFIRAKCASDKAQGLPLDGGCRSLYENRAEDNHKVQVIDRRSDGQPIKVVDEDGLIKLK